MPRSALWKSIAEALGSEISDGHYRPGDKLPTEAQLAARFGVNRHTVRHALAALAQQGIVHSRRGSGVFVAVASSDYALGRRVSFHQNVIASGRSPSREVLRLETRRADRGEAEALDLGPGADVHVYEGRSFADGVPLASFRSVFPAARFPGLCARLAEKGSVTAALRAEGVDDYTRASTRLTATSASATLALHLRLPEGAPILRSVAINVDLNGHPVEYGTTWFAGDRVTLTVSPDS
jgi:GntR family transcriptional regulator, phosphonate transport system regulatory protein